MIVWLADGDGDGTTTAAEFDDFLAMIDANGDGLIDETELEGMFLRGGLDRDEDGLLEVEDFRQIFADLDANGDGQVTSDELPRFRRGRGRFAARFLVRLADANENGEVTGAEWRTLIAQLDGNGDGVIGEAEWLAVAPAPEGEEPRPERFERFTRIFDRNDNDVLEVSDLETIFNEIDTDGSGVIEEDELPGRRG